MGELMRREFLNGLLAGAGALAVAPALARGAEGGKKDEYRLGIIGLDGHTNYTLKPLPKLPNVHLIAIAISEEDQTRNRGKFEELPEGIKVYRDRREMLANESLDIVSLHTIHGTTADRIVDCTQAGTHIFSEKPLATTLEDLDRVKKAVADAGITLTMMLNMRSYGLYRKVHDIVHDGTIGEVTQCTAQKSYKLGDRPAWVQSRETYAGTIPYIGCHAIDLIRWCSGLRFIKGAAFHKNIGRPEIGDMENSSSIILLAKSGATVSVRLDYCRPWVSPTWGDDRLRIAGVDGVVEVLNGKIILITDTQPPHEVQPAESVSQFGNMIAAIEGREGLIVPTEDCYRVTEIILKLRNAADTQTMTVL